MENQTKSIEFDIDLDVLADSKMVSPEQAAKLLGIGSDTLSVWRCTGRYNLPFVKIGRCVRYRAGDLKAFVERRTRGAA